MRNRKGKKPLPAGSYPRPQLEREGWFSLDGPWDFCIDADGTVSSPDAVNWGRTIQVPFALESPLSGVEDTGLYRRVWYRRAFDRPSLRSGQRAILHFGAVDYEATAWINGKLAVRHEGGYTPFEADITDLLTDSGQQVIVVRADDDPADLSKPRGKQDWQLHPHSIWYYRTTGIWQTVWIEVVPETYLARLRWAPDAQTWQIGLDVRLGGAQRDGLQLRVRLTAGDRLLADDSYSVTSDQIIRQIGIPDPGIDDARNEMLWSPESPRLIDSELELRTADGAVIDRVRSYTALRSIALLGNRFVLNGKPYYQRLVLDQGYWPEGGMTAPDDDAFRRDIELAKSMGFNGVRMHQKIENPRFLYWADRLGLLVWEEMPSAYQFSKRTVGRLTRQWTEAILRDISHPCIVAWVPFNESWGVPDLPDSPAQRNFVQAMYHLTKTFDPTRPVIGNDGWEAVATDIVTVHDYDSDPQRLARRYGGADAAATLLKSERPGNKVLILPEFTYQNQPVMLTEFGGIAFSSDGGDTWGYSRASDAADFARRYYLLLETVRSLPFFCGFCYTQLTDTYQEANGLLFMDRRPKLPLEQVAVATRGPMNAQDAQLEATWRAAVMGAQREGRSEPKVRADR